MTIMMIFALIMSVALHEVAHGYMALRLGDPTAKLQGRLSLNPLVHLDPMMSVIIPAFLVLSGSPLLFGAAKPVPYNPYNLRDQKYGEAKVALAGPMANILLAVIFAVAARLLVSFNLSLIALELLIGIIYLNIFLALFNLLPIPPLDGSKILPVLLPFDLRMKYQTLRIRLEQQVALAFMIIIFLVVFVFGPLLTYATSILTRLLIGF